MGLRASKARLTRLRLASAKIYNEAVEVINIAAMLEKTNLLLGKDKTLYNDIV